MTTASHCASPDCSATPRTWPDSSVLCVHHRLVGIEAGCGDGYVSQSEDCERRAYEREMRYGEER